MSSDFRGSAEAHYFAMNRAGWDQRANAHFGSSFYDVEGFVAGQTSLREIELAELENVSGKALLHLQCHFGLDTLSWVRKGAVCTGVDISPVAIGKGRQLAARTGLEAKFVCSDVYSFRPDGSAPYDIVYTSYGAVCWLPDLHRWAGIVAANLAVGGVFYMVEFHPIYDLLAGYSYFTRAEPDVEEGGTYTENGADVVARLATWAHPLSNVLNALIGVGIQIERVNEFPFSPYNCFEGMTEREPGRFYLSHRGNDVPIVYSIAGRKVA
jgi:SAM-dependent methyltransferase